MPRITIEDQRERRRAGEVITLLAGPMKGTGSRSHIGRALDMSGLQVHRVLSFLHAHDLVTVDNTSSHYARFHLTLRGVAVAQKIAVESAALPELPRHPVPAIRPDEHYHGQLGCQCSRWCVRMSERAGWSG